MTFEEHEEVSLLSGKYKVIHENKNNKMTFKATRYDEEWRNLIGDNLVFAMFNEIIRLKSELENK